MENVGRVRCDVPREFAVRNGSGAQLRSVRGAAASVNASALRAARQLLRGSKSTRAIQPAVLFEAAG